MVEFIGLPGLLLKQRDSFLRLDKEKHELLVLLGQLRDALGELAQLLLPSLQELLLLPDQAGQSGWQLA